MFPRSKAQTTATGAPLANPHDIPRRDPLLRALLEPENKGPVPINIHRLPLERPLTQRHRHPPPEHRGPFPPLGPKRKRAGVSVEVRIPETAAGKPITFLLRADQTTSKGDIELTGQLAKTLKVKVEGGFCPAPRQSPPAASLGCPAEPWTGEWDVNFTQDDGYVFNPVESLTLQRSGGTVCARWGWNPLAGGTLGSATGTVSGSNLTLSGKDGFGPQDWMLELSPDGSSFAGRYSVQDSAGHLITGSIRGVRLGGPQRDFSC